MNETLVEIVLQAVKEQFTSEKAFYTSRLGISAQSWDRWKKGNQGLKAENMDKLAALFTDYEWMLVQKVCRNSLLIPEVRVNPVAEYMNMKYYVAKKWLKAGIGSVEFLSEFPEEESKERKTNQTILRIQANYDFWSYADRIELRLPGIIQEQIEVEKRDLLELLEEHVENKFPIEH